MQEYELTGEGVRKFDPTLTRWLVCNEKEVEKKASGICCIAGFLEWKKDTDFRYKEISYCRISRYNTHVRYIKKNFYLLTGTELTCMVRDVSAHVGIKKNPSFTRCSKQLLYVVVFWRTSLASFSFILVEIERKITKNESFLHICAIIGQCLYKNCTIIEWFVILSS